MISSSMMDTTVSNKHMPLPMAELLPGLSGILSKEAKQTLTEKKQTRLTIATRTTEKVFRPMTIAEMRADIQALIPKSPRRNVQGATSTKKRWNSSVKVEKKGVSHTATGEMKKNPVRKVLTFQQPKPKIPKIEISNARMTVYSETPKFQKPAKVAKKSMYLEARNAIRISGICQIAETPILTNKPVKSRMTLTNKENVPNQAVINNKMPTPKSSLRKQIMLSRIPDTPISTVSWNSSCDASFLQNEKDTEFIEDQIKTLPNEKILQNTAEVSHPVSTPFKEYRNVKEFFNNSSDIMDNSTTAYYDNTIMSFDKTSKENSLQQDTSIVSLCDLLTKATVSKSDPEKNSLELDDLLGIQKEIENNLKMVENGINILKNIKESEHKSLLNVKKLINVKQMETSNSEKDKTIIKATKDIPTIHVEGTPIKSPVVARQCSVIKSCLKSPSYKIPKKNATCMRKKVLFHKTLPDVSRLSQTPPKDMGVRALSMYMKMKKDMNFLSTPVVNKVPMETPDTPAITSHNLQIQLDKLYDKS